MDPVPLVSLVILNHNRKESLRRCLESALRIEWPRLERIVVDNASEDDSPEMVETEFGGRVTLIRRDVNCVTAGRNEGFERASGEVVFSVDNDISFPDPKVVEKAVRLFQTIPEAGALACKVTSPDQPDRHQTEHWWHPVSQEQGESRFFFSLYFPEAAVFFRRDVLRQTGGYDPIFNRGGEQLDLSFSILKTGFRTLYCPSLVVEEEEVRGEWVSRDSEIHTLNLRNKLWTAWKHFPIGKAVPYILSRSLSAGLRAARYGYPGRFLRGLRQGLFPPAVIRNQRDPLPKERWAIHDRIQKGWFVDPDDRKERTNG